MAHSSKSLETTRPPGPFPEDAVGAERATREEPSPFAAPRVDACSVTPSRHSGASPGSTGMAGYKTPKVTLYVLRVQVAASFTAPCWMLMTLMSSPPHDALIYCISSLPAETQRPCVLITSSLQMRRNSGLTSSMELVSLKT